MTFVSGTEVWIEAYLTENNLGRVDIGDSVEVVLDIHPGRVFQGVVASYGGGVSVGGEARAGDLPRPPSASGWMRDPQRFPLRIRLPEYEAGDEYDDVRYQVNGQADVIVYTSDNVVINVIGRGWIRLMSLLSYAY
jgi:multidrug resistance efflux pump